MQRRWVQKSYGGCFFGVLGVDGAPYGLTPAKKGFPDEQNIKEGFQLSSQEFSLEEFSQQRRTAEKQLSLDGYVGNQLSSDASSCKKEHSQRSF